MASWIWPLGISCSDGANSRLVRGKTEKTWATWDNVTWVAYGGLRPVRLRSGLMRALPRRVLAASVLVGIGKRETEQCGAYVIDGSIQEFTVHGVIHAVLAVFFAAKLPRRHVSPRNAAAPWEPGLDCNNA